MKKEKQTPLMRQYTQIKNKYPETVLLFRLGDFFETFNEDAVITSKVCGIALTKRNNGAAGNMPLAGFPHHQLDSYLPKLVRAGYRVAVCEQLEDPKQSRGIVRRDVIEVVTPGVALYEKLLDTKKNNYVAALDIKTDKGDRIAGLACADISTGEFFTTEFAADEIANIIEALNPSEILYSKSKKAEIEEELSRLSYDPAVTKLEHWIFDPEFGKEALLGHFRTKNLKGFGIDNYTVGLSAAGAILHYINETQKIQLSHIKKISAYNHSEFMTLDYSTRRNLEITYSWSDSSQAGSLISILDKTCTAMGGRLFKKWITRPLLNLDKIHRRLEAVRAFLGNEDKRLALRNILDNMGDIERLIQKICTGRANPRDVMFLKNSLEKLPDVSANISSYNNPALTKLAEKIDTLPGLVELIDKALTEEPTAAIGTGNVFRKGYSTELDEYVFAKLSAKDWMAEFQDKERERTGIPSLKVGFNNVFGYYIEITKAHKSRAPEDYDRKQTLTNAERYITPELKEFEVKILNAEEKIAELEQALFTELRQQIALHTVAIQEIAAIVASVDCLQSFAQASIEYNYTEPEIDNSAKIEIKAGRHPVVERMLPIGENYTPNSTVMDSEGEQIHIITGPNMSGKSCYLRQTALIILLGQVGCFVPAKKAKFGIVDRIFTRVGAQDNITAGESTFLVEMQEAANILNNATDKSLILLDEVGRGTATFDGISIAWAISEHIHNHIGAKTLFATHYHELNDLANRYDHIVNYQVEVIEKGGSVIFTHNVRPGGADHSFGIHVAQMAGLPYDVINRASLIMRSFEGTDEKEENGVTSKTPDVSTIETKKVDRINQQLSIFEFRDDRLRNKLLGININNVTPVQALQILSEMVTETKKEEKKRKK